jgi:plasmid stabilization system protein ParE
MTVSISGFARRRLYSIWRWVSDSSSRQPADKLETRLLERANSLSRQPLKGPTEPVLAFMNKGHRYLICGRYKIIYRVEGEVIHITDFFDTKQHPSRMRG